MDCTDAYRAALIRDLSSTASPAPAAAPVEGQRQAAQAGREGVAGGPLRRRTDPGQDDLGDRGAAMAPAEDATVVNGEVIGQR